MPAHGAKAEAITEVIMDMSPAYIAGVQTHFPNARIVFDLFHIMKLAGEALDAVRKSLRKEGADLTGGLWALRGNEWTRSQEQLDLRRSWRAPTRSWVAPSPCAKPSKGCWPMATAFRPLVAGLGRPFPARTLPQTLPNAQRTLPRRPGLSRNPPDNAAIEAVNGLLQMAKRIARGFRNFHYFRIAAYLKASRLNLQVPHPLPT